MEMAVSEAVISGYLLALVRAAAWLLVAPPFAGRTLPTQVKVGFAAALALAVGPQIADRAPPLEVVPLLGAAVMQIAAGVALGYVAMLLFAVIQAAGGLIDNFSGLNIAQMLDPSTSSMTSIFGRFYQVLATTLLFALNGHVLLVRGFLASFEAASLTSVDMDSLADMLTADIGRFLVAALEISAPVVAALLLTELALSLLSRAAPAMNVFVLGMPLKLVVTISLAAVAVPLLPEVVRSLLDPMVRHGLQVVGG